MNSYRNKKILVQYLVKKIKITFGPDNQNFSEQTLKMATAVYFSFAKDTDSQTQTHRCSADAFKLEAFSLYLLKLLQLYSHHTVTLKEEREPVMNHHLSL